MNAAHEGDRQAGLFGWWSAQSVAVRLVLEIVQSIFTTL